MRHYLHQDPADDLDQLMEQHAAALWIEERQQNLTTNAMAKALGAR